MLSVYHVSDALPPKTPPLIAGGSYLLVLGSKGLKGVVLEPLVVPCLSYFFKGVTAFVQDENKSSGSWPGSIFVLTSFSWHAFLAAFRGVTAVLHALHCAVVSYSLWVNRL